jgi:hypothetical protein
MNSGPSDFFTSGPFLDWALEEKSIVVNAKAGEGLPDHRYQFPSLHAIVQQNIMPPQYDLIVW